MKWQEGQRVECAGLNWGNCFVTMTNPDLVIVYCSQYEIVTTGSPEQLEQAGWTPVNSQKVIYVAEWMQKHRQQQSPAPTQ